MQVTDRVLNTVRPELFGDNIEWTNNGMGIWLPGEGRADLRIVRALKDMGVRHLRYPGGTLSDYFDWSKAVGRERVAQPNPFEKGRTQVPAFGPDELASLCRLLSIPAMLTVNAGTGTPETAGAWARYCREKRLSVSAFEVGNEVYMADPNKPDVPATPIAKTPEQYAEFYLRCQARIRDACPGVPVGVIGLVDTGAFPLNHYPDWLARVLTKVGDWTDFVAIHNGYAPVVRTTGVGALAKRLSDDDFASGFLAAPVYVRGNLRATKEVLSRLAPRATIHVTEFGPLVFPVDQTNARGDVAWNTSLAGALYLAALYNVFLSEPKVTSANHLPLCQDVFGALLGIRPGTPRSRIWRNATAHVFRLYSHLVGRRVLAVEATGPAYAAQSVGIVPALRNVPYLDAAAYASRDGRSLAVVLINRDLTRAARVRIYGVGKGLVARSILTLAAPSYMDRNDPEHPNRVSPRRATLSSGQTRNGGLTVPPHSLSMVEYASRPHTSMAAYRRRWAHTVLVLPSMHPKRSLSRLMEHSSTRQVAVCSDPSRPR